MDRSQRRLKRLLALVAWGALTLPIGLLPLMERILPACAYEDSTWCVWNAQKRHNGEGTSFVNLADRIVYFK